MQLQLFSPEDHECPGLICPPPLVFSSRDGSREEGGHPGLRPVSDEGDLGGPGEEIQTEAEEGGGEDREECPDQVNQTPADSEY